MDKNYIFLKNKGQFLQLQTFILKSHPITTFMYTTGTTIHPRVPFGPHLVPALSRDDCAIAHYAPRLAYYRPQRHHLGGGEYNWKICETKKKTQINSVG